MSAQLGKLFPLKQFFSNVSIGSSDDAVVQLLPLAMKLFYRMVDCGAPFHLTLINVCFSNLQSRAAAVTGKGSITSFFSQSASPKKSQTVLSQCQVKCNVACQHCQIILI